jgi:hypothetical protein
MHQMGMSRSDKLHLVEMAFHAFKLMLCAFDVAFGEKFASGCDVFEGTTFEVVRMFTCFAFVFFHHQRFTVN